MSKNNPEQQEKLVTIAIHTFEKAQVLQTLLQSEGIEASLQNVNQILPIVSAGVRVRIKESDLPHALDVIENNNWNRPELYAELNQVDGYNKEASLRRLLPTYSYLWTLATSCPTCYRLPSTLRNAEAST